ncbi:MAG: hypothetical protein ACK5HY_06885 [Parahaliea sp.]
MNAIIMPISLAMLLLASLPVLAQAQFGPLDQNRGVTRQSEPWSSKKENTFIVSEDRNTKEKSAVEERLEQIGGGEIGGRATSEGVNFGVKGEKIAVLDKAKMKEGSVDAANEIKRMLMENRVLFGGADYFNDIEIEVILVHLSNFSGHNDYSIQFRQYINGLAVPRSKIIMYGDGSVKILDLKVVNPNSIIYDKHSWMNEEDLFKIASGLLRNEKNYEPHSSAESHYSIIISPLHQSLRPVYTLIAGPYAVVLDAVTGEKVVLTDSFISESRCIRAGTANPARDKNCSDTIGGVLQYEKYLELGSCLNNHPACGNTPFLEIYMGVNGVKNWLTNLGWPVTPPSNFDFRVNAVFAGSG